MIIHTSRKFEKHFKTRIASNPKLHDRFDERVALFVKNPDDPLLKDHKLVGKRQSFRAFSITGDIRVIYVRESKNEVTFVDIGTHSQVYRE